ncbi:MAG: DUF1648 domain-containing protein [Candidatus Sulfotelmatobacter sp.]
MSGNWYKSLVGLMWLALPLSALEYWRGWDQFPARMAVHFNVNGQANGFTSREGALEAGLGIMAAMLVVFTLATLAAHALKPEASWPVLVVAYVVLGFVWYGNHAIVRFNRNAVHSAAVSPQLSILSSRCAPPNWRSAELMTEN